LAYAGGAGGDTGDRLAIEVYQPPEARPLAPLREPAFGQALEVFLDLLQLERVGDADTFGDLFLLEALAGEDDERLHDLGRVAAAEDEVPGPVEMVVDELAPLGEMVEYPLQVLHAVADVAGLVLHDQPEELLIALRRRDVLAEAEERQDHA